MAMPSLTNPAPFTQSDTDSADAAQHRAWQEQAMVREASVTRWIEHHANEQDEEDEEDEE